MKTEAEVRAEIKRLEKILPSQDESSTNASMIKATLRSLYWFLGEDIKGKYCWS